MRNGFPSSCFVACFCIIGVRISSSINSLAAIKISS